MISFFKNREDMYKHYVPGMCGVEVGVQAGHNAQSLLNAGALELHCVDFWKHVDDGDYALDVANHSQPDQDHLFGSVLRRFHEQIESGRVFVHRLPSLQAAPLFGIGSMDFAYIDSSHLYEDVYADLKAWSAAVNETGCLLGHDFTDREEAINMKFGVTTAVLDFCSDQKWKIVALTTCGWPSYALTRK